MVFAMRGFLDLKSGKPCRLNNKYTYMARFFHGSPLNYPSQIKLHLEGCSSYCDILEEEVVKNTKQKRRILTKCGFFASRMFSLIRREGYIVVEQIFGGRILKRKIGREH